MATGPMSRMGNATRQSTEQAHKNRLERKPKKQEGPKVEKQRVREQKPSRRAQENKAAERARARRAEQDRSSGGRLDVRA